MKLQISLIKLIGEVLALSMAYSMWEWKGCLFTLGLILGGSNGSSNRN